MVIIDTIIIFASALSVLTLAIVQLVKTSTNIPNKLMPLISTLIGLIVGAVALFIPEINGDLSVGGHLLAGAISGLSASGLYDLASKTKQGFEDNSGNF